MNNKFRILYLKDESSQNSEFIKYLVKNYNAQVYNYVLPNIIESRLGHLDFSTLKDYYDIDWNVAIQSINSKDDITFDFGFDFYSDDPESVAFEFRKCLMHYFDSLNFKYTNKTKIKKIVSSIKKSKKFIRESDIFKYDLIIIENLATNISVPLKTYKGKTKYSPTSGDNIPLYTQYKITPNLLNKVLNSNTRLLLLMDYDYNSFRLMNESLIRYKKMMQRIGICNFELADKSIDDYFAKNPELLVGIDFEKRINDTLCEFNISLDDNYKQSIPERLSQYYNDVSNIYVNYPIQLTTDSKNNIKANSKILLSGNNETTKLYPKWDNEIYDDIKRHEIFISCEGVSKKSKRVTTISPKDDWITQSKEFHDIRKLYDIKHLNDFDYATYFDKYTYFNKLPPKESIFAVADTLYNSTYLMLSGHIFSDNFINKKKCSNKKFASNTIEYLTSQSEPDLNSKKEYLPIVTLKKDTGELLVSFMSEHESNCATIKLSPMEFCYYLYFLERAKKEMSYTTVVEEEGTGYNEGERVDFKDYNISSKIIEQIISYYRVSFPKSAKIQDLKKLYDNKLTPNVYDTFRPNVLHINTKIKSNLKNLLNERLINYIIISKAGKLIKTIYGIKLPADNIKILEPNKNVDIIS